MKPLTKCNHYSEFHSSQTKLQQAQKKAQSLRSEIERLLSQEKTKKSELSDIEVILQADEVFRPIREKMKAKAAELEKTLDNIDALKAENTEHRKCVFDFYFKQIEAKRKALFEALQKAAEINEEIRSYHLDARQQFDINAWQPSPYIAKQARRPSYVRSASAKVQLDDMAGYIEKEQKFWNTRKSAFYREKLTPEQ